MAELQPYQVMTTDPEDYTIGALVWARNESEAASLGRAVLLPDDDSDDGVSVEDSLTVIEGFGPPPSPVVESRARWLRAYGWSCEGDDKCSGCGLASMDGDFPVCPDCECCEECDHHKECPRVLLLGEAQAKAFGPVRGRLIYLASEVDHHDPVHEARLALLSKLLVHMGGMPVLAAPSPPRKPWHLHIDSMPARAIHRCGGGVLGLELDTGDLSISAALSLSSTSPRGPWRHGKGRGEGVARVRWASLTPAFVAAGMEAECKAAEATAGRWRAALQRMRDRRLRRLEAAKPRLITTTAPKPLVPPVADDVGPCLQVERDGLGEPAVCTLISGHASAHQDGESGHAWSLLSPTDDA